MPLDTKGHILRNGSIEPENGEKSMGTVGFEPTTFRV